MAAVIVAGFCSGGVLHNWTTKQGELVFCSSDVLFKLLLEFAYAGLSAMLQLTYLHHLMFELSSLVQQACFLTGFIAVQVLKLPEGFTVFDLKHA